jgi:hypothetical protein
MATVNVTNHGWQDLRCFSGKLIEYQPKNPAFNKLKGDYEAKAIRILTTKRNRFAWEQEFRLMLDAPEAGMTKVGTVKEIILGGCCHKSDARFNKIRSEVCKRGIPVSYAYLDFEHETVEIQQAAECAMCNNRGQK